VPSIEPYTGMTFKVSDTLDNTVFSTINIITGTSTISFKPPITNYYLKVEFESLTLFNGQPTGNSVALKNVAKLPITNC
jgi:hypothetical protein